MFACMSGAFYYLLYLFLEKKKLKIKNRYFIELQIKLKLKYYKTMLKAIQKSKVPIW